MKISRIFAGLALVVISVNAKANTDVVIFHNGDRLTGEVKGLEKGLLRFKTDATGTISIEWDDVAYVSSDQHIRVETVEGVRFFGQLPRAEEEDKVIVESGGVPIELDSMRINSMTPIEETRSGRIDGTLTAGFDFAKATNITQTNVGLDLDYLTELRRIGLSYDFAVSNSAETEASQRQDLSGTYRRLWPNRWFTTGLVRLTQNDELGIDLRTSIGAGGGRIALQSNSMSVWLEGGLLVSRENIASGIESSDTLEAYAGGHWDWFRYDYPEVDLTSSLIVYPNLTDTGRVRTEFDIKFRWEFIEDLFWQLSYYNSYDSDPADPTASKLDYGINTSLAWDF